MGGVVFGLYWFQASFGDTIAMVQLHKTHKYEY